MENKAKRPDWVSDFFSQRRNLQKIQLRWENAVKSNDTEREAPMIGEMLGLRDKHGTPINTRDIHERLKILRRFKKIDELGIEIGNNVRYLFNTKYKDPEEQEMSDVEMETEFYNVEVYSIDQEGKVYIRGPGKTKIKNQNSFVVSPFSLKINS